MFLRLLLLTTVFFTACGNTKSQATLPSKKEANRICERFDTPDGFERVVTEKNTFAYYLQHFPLKADTAKVYYYNGQLKPNHWVAKAVLDIDVGKDNLQQCADAVMRLRAEYLYAQKQYNQIHFNFTNGFRADYQKWAEGYRIKVDGNQVSWVKQSGEDYTYQTFRNYLTKVFTYAGTLSLSREMRPVSIEDMAIGDVFIQGGSPGHVVLVVDMAVNQATGEKAFLLVQSYMPAQSIHLLVNPQDSRISPWYIVEKEQDELQTPEWYFNKTDLKRFAD